MGDNKAEALKEKGLGNDAYKKKDFATAIEHYQKVRLIKQLNTEQLY